MKKTSLLSLLTAAAIVTTSAGTFAIWDQVTATKTVTLTTDKAHTVSLNSGDLTFDNTLSSEKMTTTAEFSVDTENATGLALTTKNVTLGGTAQIDESKVKVEILDSQGQPITDTITPTNGESTYKVKVSLTAADASTNAALYADKAISFEINADITK